MGIERKENWKRRRDGCNVQNKYERTIERQALKDMRRSDFRRECEREGIVLKKRSGRGKCVV
jgi:hypothetical protein